MKVPGYDYAAFCQGINARDGAVCRFRHLDACDGVLDGHHLLSKSWLKREFPKGVWEQEDGTWLPLVPISNLFPLGGWHDPLVPHRRTLADLLNDPRNGIACCRKHHDLLEGHRIGLRYEDLPAHALEFAAELGSRAVARLERNYPEAKAA